MSDDRPDTATDGAGTVTDDAHPASSESSSVSESDADSTLDALVSRWRFGQFVSVGAAGATVETVLLAIATTTFALDPLVAKVIGAEASISLMFLLNDRWTFAGEGTDDTSSIVGRWLRSHTVRLFGLAVAFSVLFVLTSYTTVTLDVFGRDLWPTVANCVGIGVGMVLNYVAESLFTWRVTE